MRAVRAGDVGGAVGRAVVDDEDVEAGPGAWISSTTAPTEASSSKAGTIASRNGRAGRGASASSGVTREESAARGLRLSQRRAFVHGDRLGRDAIPVAELAHVLPRGGAEPRPEVGRRSEEPLERRRSAAGSRGGTSRPVSPSRTRSSSPPTALCDDRPAVRHRLRADEPEALAARRARDTAAPASSRSSSSRGTKPSAPGTRERSGPSPATTRAARPPPPRAPRRPSPRRAAPSVEHVRRVASTPGSGGISTRVRHRPRLR